MNRRSPTMEGFRVLFREPALGCAEVAWRWSFGSAVLVLLLFSCFELLDTIPVSTLDLLLVGSKQPFLASRAIADMFQGSAHRFTVTAVILAIGLSLAWAGVASLGRSAILRRVVEYFRPTERSGPEPLVQHASSGFRALLGLNFARVVVTFLAIGGCLSVLLLGSLLSRSDNSQPTLTFVVTSLALLLLGLLWSVLNWFLSVASIFAVRDGQTTFAALNSAMLLCCERLGPVLAVGFWFGLAHVTAFSLATTAVAFPLALLGALPTIFAVSGVIVVTLAYFATVDWLYMGRLAAYVAIVEFPSVPVIAEPASPSPRVIGPQATARIDPVSGFVGSEKPRWEGIPSSDDDILSDTPPDRS